MPGGKETVKWNSLCYETDGNVCSIKIHASHVNLQFFNGAGIRNPAIPLEGTGKNMRHIKFAKIKDIDSNLLEKLIKQAS